MLTGGVMLPVILDLSTWPVLVAGRGPALAKRIALLADAGAADVTVRSPDPEIDGGPWPVQRRLPTEAEVAAARLVIAAGLSPPEEQEIGGAARRHRAVLNIEDRLPWCDVHMPAIVRRGDLLLTVSTGGRSPGFAATVRGWLEKMFPPAWAEHLRTAATLRDRLRAEGATPAEVLARTRELAFLRQPPT